MLVPTHVPPQPIPFATDYDIRNIAHIDRKATRVPRLPFKRYIPSRPPASLLTVKPQSSILAPHVLNAMKMTLITGTHGPPREECMDVIKKRKVEEDEITPSNKKNKPSELIQTRDVIKAEAAYGIARNLVAWMDGIDIIDDSEFMSDEKLEEEIKHEEIKQEYGMEIKREDITSQGIEIKREDMTSLEIKREDFSTCDEKLEEECSMEIKQEDAKNDGEEKRDDWYSMSGSLLSFDHSFSYLDDALRAQEHTSPTSDVVTPPTVLSLTSEISMESQGSAQRSVFASQASFSAPPATCNPGGSPVPQQILQYEAPLAPLASPPSSPMPLSLPLLPTLSEMHTYLPLRGSTHYKIETQHTLFPSRKEDWQAFMMT